VLIYFPSNSSFSDLPLWRDAEFNKVFFWIFWDDHDGFVVFTCSVIFIDFFMLFIWFNFIFRLFICSL
jgi:hypothetical protein